MRRSEVGDLVRFYTGFDWTTKVHTGIVIEKMINPMGCEMYHVYSQQTMQTYTRTADDLHEIDDEKPPFGRIGND